MKGKEEEEGRKRRLLKNTSSEAHERDLRTNDYHENLLLLHRQMKIYIYIESSTTTILLLIWGTQMNRQQCDLFYNFLD